MKLSRRNFIKGAATSAIAASSIIIPFIGTAEATPSWAGNLPKRWDHETEVLVVGTGCSGLCAAVEAVKKGVKVTVLEKRAVIGGDVVLSAGIFYSAKTKHHLAAGITQGISPEEYWAFMQTGIDDEPLNRVRDNSHLSPIYYGITKHNPEIMKRNALESAKVIEFLDQNGVEMLPMNPLKPWQLAAKNGEMGKLMTKLLRNVQAKGAKVMMETRANKLYINESGKIVGLRAENEDGKSINIKAQAVIIATGGFIDNPYLMKRYQSYWSTVAKGFLAKGKGVYSDHTGDGIMMAKEINASLEDMSAGVKLYGGPEDGRTPSVSWIIFDTQPAYMVNEKGKRLVNEVVGRYNGCALSLLRSKSKAGYTIFDNKTFNSSANERFGLTKALENGGLFKANTVAELAKSVGIDGKGLEETVKRINADVKKGIDSEFGKSGETFQSLEAPFYISAPCVPLSYKTEGGIEVNPNYQVLEHTEEKEIPGLYAVGATVGSISTRHLDCFNSGFIAGGNAAEEAIKARSREAS